MDKSNNEILEHLIRIEIQLIGIESKIDKLNIEENNEKEILLDIQDVMKILKVSHRTLQRYRTENILPYMIKRGTVYFLESDVQKFIKEYDSRKFDKRKKNKS